MKVISTQNKIFSDLSLWFCLSANWTGQFLGDHNSFLTLVGIWKKCTGNSLKVISATFSLVCFLSLKKGTFETRKNVFDFTSKTLFVLEKIKV